MKTFRSKRQMRPHIFFAFIPLATFAPRLLMLSPPISHLSSLSIHLVLCEAETTMFTMRLGVELEGGKSGRKNMHSQGSQRLVLGQKQKLFGPPLSTGWSVILELQRAIFTGDPAASLYFSYTFSYFPSLLHIGWLLFGAEVGNVPINPPPTGHPDTFLHPFIPMFHSFCLNRRQGNCISDFTCLAPN